MAENILKEKKSLWCSLILSLAKRFLIQISSFDCCFTKEKNREIYFKKELAIARQTYFVLRFQTLNVKLVA